MQVKGGSVQCVAKRIVITSNAEPESWYKFGEKQHMDYATLERRFDAVFMKPSYAAKDIFLDWIPIKNAINVTLPALNFLVPTEECLPLDTSGSKLRDDSGLHRRDSFRLPAHMEAAAAPKQPSYAEELLGKSLVDDLNDDSYVYTFDADDETEEEVGNELDDTVDIELSPFGSRVIIPIPTLEEMDQEEKINDNWGAYAEMN